MDIPTDPNIYIAGSISGGIWIIQNLLSFVAIKNIGISSAISIWVSLSIIVSFVWGQVAFPDENKLNIIIALFGIFLLVLGAIGSATSLKNNDMNDMNDMNELYSSKNKKKGIICAIMI